MECDKVRERMSDYIEGLVTLEEGVLMRTHIASCRKCGAAYSELEKTIIHIKSLEKVEPPAWLTQKVMAKVKEEASRQGIWKRLFYPLHIKLPLEAAATVLVAVTALYIFKATEHETKIAEVRPGEITKQQLRMEEDSRQNGAKTGKTIEKSILGETKAKALSPQAGPPAELKGELAQKPDHDDLSQETPQKESATKNIAPAPPAPALQTEKKDTAGGGFEAPSESKTSDERKAKGSMRYAASPEREELKREPAAAPMTKMEKVISEEDRISKKDITLNLHVMNIDNANDEIKKALSGLGARIVETEAVSDKTTLTIEMDSKNIKGFFEKLGTVGELGEKEPPAGMRKGNVKVKIEIVKASVR
jgi:soluble P-type ATPase